MKGVARILILVPAETARGGITNYFGVIRKHFPDNVDFFIRGARKWPYRQGKVREFVRAIWDLMFFTFRLTVRNYSIVQTSTSLGKISIIRDGLFILVSKAFGTKTIVFFRGWNPEKENEIDGFVRNMFNAMLEADQIFVLSCELEKKLANDYQFKGNLIRETTIVDETYLKNLPKAEVVRTAKDSLRKILFLGRLERDKGIFELLEAFHEISRYDANLSLIFAGDGRDEVLLRQKVRTENIMNVEFLGFVSGKVKHDVFLDADIYVLPSYTEGMPNSVLEAMAYGLPIITRPVGGISDIVTNGVNGFLEESTEASMFAAHLNWMREHPSELECMSDANYELAKSNFWSSIVAKRILNHYEKLLDT